MVVLIPEPCNFLCVLVHVAYVPSSMFAAHDVLVKTGIVKMALCYTCSTNTDSFTQKPHKGFPIVPSFPPVLDDCGTAFPIAANCYSSLPFCTSKCPVCIPTQFVRLLHVSNMEVNLTNWDPSVPCLSRHTVLMWN